MYCPYCGAKISDEARFCGQCGKAVRKGEKAVTGEKVNRTHICKKKSLFVRIAETLVIMLIFIGGALGGMIKLGILDIRTDLSDYCVVLSDGEYRLVPLTQETVEDYIKIADLESDSVDGSGSEYGIGNYVHMTEDKEYLYFFSKLDEYGEFGNLYRAELRKLLAGDDQSAYITKIASDVSTEELIVRENHTIIYKKKDSDDYTFRVYYFDGENSSIVAKNVCSFTAWENYVFYTNKESGEESYTLYGQMLESDEKRKIAAYIENDFYVKDSEHILYFKWMSDEDHNYEVMYIAGYSTEPEKLSTDVYDGTWYYTFRETGKFYYTKTDGQTMHLSDFVENPYSDTDWNMEEPDYYDEKYDDDDDGTAYEEDYEKYEAAVRRMDLMDYLSGQKCDSLECSLYYYDISLEEPVLISDQVDNYRVSSRMTYSNGHTAAAYFKSSGTIKKISIERIINEYDGTYSNAESIITDYIRSNSANVDILYCTADGREACDINMQTIGFSDVLENDNTSNFMFAIYNNGRNLAFSSVCSDASGEFFNDNDIYIASVNGQKISEFKGIKARDAVFLGAFGDQLGYYSAGQDFNMYINGKHVFVAENEYWTIRTVGYEDGDILIWTDCFYLNGGMIVRVTSSGEMEKITDESENVYALEDGKVLFVTDKDLKLYDKKEIIVLAGDVDYCWCADIKDVV